MNLDGLFVESLRVVDHRIDAEYVSPRSTTRYRLVDGWLAAISVREAAASGGAYATTDSRFNVAVVNAEATPEVGGLVYLPDGRSLSVIGVDTLALGSRYRLTLASNGLTLAANGTVIGGNATIRVQQPVAALDGDRVPTPTWSTLGTQRAAIVETRAGISRLRDALNTERMYDVFLQDTYQPLANWRLLDDDDPNIIYNVLDVTGRAAITSLVRLSCVRALTPRAA